MCDRNQSERLKPVHVSASANGREMLYPLQHTKDIEKLKSQVRSCVMRILTERLNKPAVFSAMDNALVTELIIEYLDWMGYNQTLETFRMECRLPKKHDDCLLDELSQSLGHSNENVLPQIFNLVSWYKNVSGRT